MVFYKHLKENHFIEAQDNFYNPLLPNSIFYPQTFLNEVAFYDSPGYSSDLCNSKYIIFMQFKVHHVKTTIMTLVVLVIPV